MFNYKFTDRNTLELIDAELAPLSCLAEFFGTKESTLRAKIEELKDSGCPLFS